MNSSPNGMTTRTAALTARSTKLPRGEQATRRVPCPTEDGCGGKPARPRPTCRKVRPDAESAMEPECGASECDVEQQEPDDGHANERPEPTRGGRQWRSTQPRYD